MVAFQRLKDQVIEASLQIGVTEFMESNFKTFKFFYFLIECLRF